MYSGRFYYYSTSLEVNKLKSSLELAKQCLRQGFPHCFCIGEILCCRKPWKNKEFCDSSKCFQLFQCEITLLCWRKLIINKCSDRSMGIETWQTDRPTNQLTNRWTWGFIVRKFATVLTVLMRSYFWFKIELIISEASEGLLDSIKNW